MPKEIEPPTKLEFVGGPHDGEAIKVIMRPRDYIFRSGIKGDDTIYYHRGTSSHQYYKFFNIWRWEGLDSFDHLIIDTGQNEARKSPPIDCDIKALSERSERWEI